MKTDDYDMPDYTLVNSDVKAGEEPPRVHAVTDLRAFVKPNLDEELGGPLKGQGAVYGRTICVCVPVLECVCNTVTFFYGACPCTVTCPAVCPCTCTGTCFQCHIPCPGH